MTPVLPFHHVLRFFVINILLQSVGASLPPENSLPIDGRDLSIFVSRPDLRPPKFSVDVVSPEAVSPGYWFLAAYVDLNPKEEDSKFRPFQTGPHIYDNQGGLVWSGAPLVSNRVTHDFKVSHINGSAHLSFTILKDHSQNMYKNGTGYLLDSQYAIQKTVLNSVGDHFMDPHEFNVVDGGKSVLMVTKRNSTIQVPSSVTGELRLQNINDSGFQEVDISTGKTIFEWWPLDHVNPLESYPWTPQDYAADYPWDFFHLNSVEKDTSGDYVISSRSMSSVFKVSGVDGSIHWQLGGQQSSFSIDEDTHFIHQHDARVLDFDPVTNTTIISMLNNFAAPHGAGRNYSAAQIMSLDATDMTAKCIQKIQRPDGHTTQYRGNVQILPNGNRFIGWSDNGLISEHTPDGQLAFQARFRSRRFVSYRAYKFDWNVSIPAEDPALAVISHGNALTVAYVSWNGATEVDRWRFFGADETGKVALVGDIARAGFETECVIYGQVTEVYAQAVSHAGMILTTTAIIKSRAGLNGDEMSEINGTYVGGDRLFTERLYQRVAETQPHNGIFVLFVGFAAGYIIARRRWLHSGA